MIHPEMVPPDGVIPEHWVEKFDSEKKWRAAVFKRHGWIVEVLNGFGQAMPTAFVDGEGGSIGQWHEDHGILIKEYAGLH